MKNKLAVITGASSGMGYYFAIEMAKNNFDLVIIARRKEKLKQLKEEIESSTKSKVEILVSDLSTQKGINNIESFLHKRNISYFFNNAGVGYFGNLAMQDVNRIDTLTKLNVVALTHLTAWANKTMAKNGGGTIVNIGSVAAYTRSAPGCAAYGASKKYVYEFSKSVNYENKKEKNNVRVVVINPGAIATEWSKNARKDLNKISQNKSTPAPVFAHRTIKSLLKSKRSFITKGAGGYWSKILRIVPLWIYKKGIYKFFIKVNK